MLAQIQIIKEIVMKEVVNYININSSVFGIIYIASITIAIYVK